MKIRKFMAAAAVGMSLVMSVSAFAAGSVTGKVENPEILSATDENGEALDTSNLTLAVESGESVADKTVEEALPEVKADSDVTVDVASMSFLTGIEEVVLRDEDGNVIKGAKNVTVSVEITNIPDGADVYVAQYDQGAWTIHSVANGSVLGDSALPGETEKKSGAVLGDSVTLSGTKLSLTFNELDNAAFSVLYVTNNSNSSNDTGELYHVVPVMILAVVAVAGSALIVTKRRRA